MSLENFLIVKVIVVGLFVVYEAIRKFVLRRLEPVIGFDIDDPQMNAAIQKAKDSLPLFWEAFEAKRAMDSEFGLKIRLEHNGNAEHIWCELIERASEQCRVVILNEPDHVPYEKGDIISVGESQITDWHFIRDDTTMGAETQKVLEAIYYDEKQAQA